MLSTDDKTEDATPKKKKDARKKGNVAKSKEVSVAITLVGFTFLIGALSPYLVDNFKIVLTDYLTSDFKMNINYITLQSMTINGLIFFFKLFLPIGAIFLVIGVITNIAQTGFMFTGEGIKPSFSKLNPINGFKNMFSMKAMGSLIKNLLVIIVLGFIGYGFIKDNYMNILKLSNVYIHTLIYTVKDILYSILSKISIALVFIALLDYLYQIYTHKKDLKMTKQEIKEEFKQMEGDPQIKGKIRQKQRQMATQRMMQSVPDATVIITNPTHISIAIKYEQGKSKAPIVVAKGADYVAFKIREIAKENDIPIIENKPLARLIYKKVEIDQEVPEEMYQAVAEILVVIYKMKNRYKTK
jgi:flagellar biosynthetic protein FliR/FlhB